MTEKYKEKGSRNLSLRSFQFSRETRRNLRLYRSTKRGNVFLGNGESFSKKMANELDSTAGQTLGNI